MKQIKKALCLIVLIGTAFSGFAETWNDYINRNTELTTKAAEYIMRRNDYRTWSNDTWGALAAIYDYTYLSFENISKNAPGLSDYEKRIYRNLSVTAHGQREAIFDLMRAYFNNPNQQWNRYIEPWFIYWFDHFKGGGTITFNY